LPVGDEIELEFRSARRQRSSGYPRTPSSGLDAVA
jgi:hypothetical protein